MRRKPDPSRVFWAALGTVFIGGMVLYHLGVRPETDFGREVIPVDEPPLLDWAVLAGMMATV